MYIVKVLVEHPVHSLDTTFDYLSEECLEIGVRVRIVFFRQRLMGYVESVEETNKTQQELEELSGFRYRYIESVIDSEPLLNDELRQLALQLSQLTLSPRISCLQAMLPTQLKPRTTQGTGIKMQRIVKVLKEGTPLTKKQQECFDYIKMHPDTIVKDIPYSRSLLDKLVEQGLITYQYIESYRRVQTSHFQETKTVRLTPQQQSVVDGVMRQKTMVSLLYGVTGSGKTEVYLALSEQMLLQNKTVIMLVPEISLTPMMVDVFQQRFGDRVAILHSRLSQGEKYDEYRRIKRQEVQIVVGARSAVFAPLQNIGLIILDEEHDASYKQETKPRYLTSQIAKMRAETYGAKVVLGSATPSLESYSRALKGVYALYTLSQRINQKPMPEVTIVDMMNEIKKRQVGIISRQMREKINEVLAKREQVILLLNKRGYASYIRCYDCGEVMKCPHCDVTLTYHKEGHMLKCHYCEYQIPLFQTCPHCGGQHLKQIGYGTQKIDEEIQELFPQAKVIRYDVDTTRNKNGHLHLLEQFKNQEASILLGTQMVAKGLDFHNVTFVGVLDADMSLNIPDFRSSERTFQLLCQVAGRSGRGDKQGTVMIQTFNPHHYVIEAVVHHDYDMFYHHEMIYRQKGKYPPYCHLVSVLIQSKNEDLLQQAMMHMKDYLTTHLHQVIILGPAKSAIYKMHDIYRQRILIKFIHSKQVYEALQIMSDYYNKEGKGKVTVVCDFNPYSQI